MYFKKEEVKSQPNTSWYATVMFSGLVIIIKFLIALAAGGLGHSF